MTKEPAFYHVSGEDSSPGGLAPGELERALGEWICPRWQCVLPGSGPIDVIINDDLELSKPFSWVSPSFLGMVWNDFIAPLGADVLATELFLGAVRRADGKLIEGWSTFHGRHRTIIRGSKKGLNYRRCQHCGRKQYTSFGPYYLCPPPPPEHQILTTDVGFVLRPELFSLLKTQGLRKYIRIDRLAVREYPNDRLPIDLVDPP